MFTRRKGRVNWLAVTCGLWSFIHNCPGPRGLGGGKDVTFVSKKGLKELHGKAEW